MRRLTQPCLQDPATNELGIALVQLALAGPGKQQFVLKGGCPSTYGPTHTHTVMPGLPGSNQSAGDAGAAELAVQESWPAYTMACPVFWQKTLT